MVCTECGCELWDSIERAHRMCRGCRDMEIYDFGLAASVNDDTDIFDAEEDDAN